MNGNTGRAALLSATITVVALGGLRSQSHLVPLLFNLHCWVSPKNFALGRAGTAFDEQGQLNDPAAQQRVKDVLDHVLWAAQRLSSP